MAGIGLGLSLVYPFGFLRLYTPAIADGEVSTLGGFAAGTAIALAPPLLGVAADAFGIELATAAKPLFAEAGFDIVYDTSYPLGTQDLSPVVKAAKAANPNAFIAWSYPPDTFGLTEQAVIEDLQVDAYYTAVATCFPAFGARFGAAADALGRALPRVWKGGGSHAQRDLFNQIHLDALIRAER